MGIPKDQDVRFFTRVRVLDVLLASLRSCLDQFPDKRRGLNTTYRLPDIGMAAFSVFFMQSPSFLAHQRHLEEGHGRSNCASLFGIPKIPSDNHIRDMLDPEFIVPQDGAEKQDCENMAAKRWLAAHGRRYAAFDAIYLGDDLFSRQPLCQAVRDVDGHFIFVCKPSSHPLIQEYLTGIDLPTFEETIKRCKQRALYRYRWLHDVPLRAGDDALKVNWFEIEIRNAQGETTYRNSFITDLPVDRENVVELAACGRARWKIENETFNVLKNKGYNLEHSFGHGKQNLAAILVALNLLAFAIHTVCDIGDDLWRAARAKLGPRYNFFNKLAAITAFLIFPSWDDLLLTLAFAKPPPLPP